MGSRSTPAPNADARRATSRQRPPRLLRLADGPSPGSAAMPDSIGGGSDCVCTLAGRLDDALLHNERLPAHPCPSPGKRPSAKVGGAKELPLRAKLVPTGERRRQIVKRPKWLPWESSETKSDHLKKVRQQTDQRMQQQEAQKEEREKNQSRSIGSAIDRPAR